MKFISSLIALTIFGTAVMAQDPTCPARCPACTRCDPKEGTCTLPRDFVTCSKGGLAGVCFAGTCNTQLSLPVTKASNRCQTYSCPASGVCNLITAPDGTDCTPVSSTGWESVCLQGVCQRIWLGVGEDMPFQNTGCVGKPNGATCDTNHVYTDGETCQNGVCRFPDGNYYGYVPAAQQAPPV